MKIKVSEFNSFDEFDEVFDDVGCEYEHITVIREKGWIKTDLMTECKSFKTVLRRFFTNLAHIPDIADWYDCILESCENGCFSMNDCLRADGSINPDRWYSWGVENLDDDLWYIFLNVKASA